MLENESEEIQEAAEEYLRALRAGEDPDVETPSPRDPALADALRRRLSLTRLLHLAGESRRTSAEDEAADDDALIPERLGRFEIDGLLGRGAFGVVYLAFDPSLNRRVTLKVPRAGSLASTEDEERFLREARSAAGLRHPGIVQVHEISAESGMPYIVREYIEGATLETILSAGRPSLQETLRLVARLAAALEYAHGKGVIHRDVKPANVLVDDGGTPYLTDFGLARFADGSVSVTTEGQILGSPAYMSPEQAAGRHEHIGARSDVYGLGVVLYEMLTGERPFAGQRAMVLYQAIHDDPKPPRRLDDRIPREVDTVCLKAMAKEPSKRYASAAEFGADIERVLEGRPILARPVGRAERLWRFCRRNPAVAGLTGSLAIILTLSAVASILAAFAFERQAARESRALVETTRQFATLNTLSGIERFDEGDLLAALPYLTRALELDHDEDEPGGSADRMRIGAVLARCPRLLQIWLHQGRVLHAIFSEDEAHVVTASEDATARVWDVASGAAAGPPLEHPGPVLRVASHPSDRRVATACTDDRVRIWDVRSGTLTVEPLDHGGSGVFRVAFRGDGDALLSAARDGTVVIWATSTGERRLRLEHALGIYDAEFSPDGSRLVTAGGDGRAVVWDARTGEEVSSVAHRGRIYDVEFSPSGESLVTASHDRTARIWTAATGAPIGPALRHDVSVLHASFDGTGRRVLTGTWWRGGRVWSVDDGRPVTPALEHPYVQESVSLSYDGRRAVTAGQDGTARVFDATTGRQLGPSLPHARRVTQVAFGRRGRLVLTASHDGTVRLWDLARQQPRAPVVSHEGATRLTGCVDPSGQLVATAGYDGRARVWDVRTGDPTTPWLRHHAQISDVEFSADGTRLVTGSFDRTARIWSTNAGRELVRMRIESVVRCARFSPDGRLVVTAEANGSVRTWSAHTGEPTEFRKSFRGQVQVAVFDAYGRHVAAGGQNAARVWRVDTGAPLGPPLEHGGMVHAVVFDDTGSRLLTACSDGRARLWDPTTGELHHQFGHDTEMRQAVFDRAGRRLLTGGGPGHVWDATSGETLTSQMRHDSVIWSVEFDPSGALAATASEDGTARVWDASRGYAVTPPMRHARRVRSAHFASSGEATRVVTLSDDGTAKIWDLPVERRPASDLVRLAHLLSGRRLDENGNLELVGREDLDHLWEALRTRYPDEFTPRREEAVLWHRRELAACERASDFESALWHIDRLLELEPSSWAMYRVRTSLRGLLAPWSEATAALSEAFDSISRWARLASSLLSR